MPDILIIVVGAASIVVGLILLSAGNIDTETRAGLVFLAIGVFLLLFVVLTEKTWTFDLNKTRVVPIESRLNEKGIEIQYIILNETFINLNKKFEGKLPSDAQIKIKYYTDWNNCLFIADINARYILSVEK